MKIISTISGGPGEIFLEFSSAEKITGITFLAIISIILVLLIFYLKKKVFENVSTNRRE